MGLSARSPAAVLADLGDPRHGAATDRQIAERVGVPPSTVGVRRRRAS